MIELNLVPDIKREYIKAQRQRTLAVTVAIFAGLAAVGVVVLLGVLIGTQAVRDKLASDAIKSEYSTLQKVEDLSGLLTIQGQLSQLTTQNDSRTIDSRIFDVLTAINPPAPNDVKFSTIKLDPVAKTISLEGKASGGYGATDILKKTILNQTLEYTKDKEQVKVPLTSSVNVVSTNYTQGSGDTREVQFSLIFVYADDLFSNMITDAHIVGPTTKIDVTDSKTHVPDSIFTAKPTTSTEESN